MTSREWIVLTYLNRITVANALDIGKHLWATDPGKGSNLIALGAAVCGRLRKRGFVAHVPALSGWRITQEGRNELANVSEQLTVGAV